MAGKLWRGIKQEPEFCPVLTLTQAGSWGLRPHCLRGLRQGQREREEIISERTRNLLGSLLAQNPSRWKQEENIRMEKDHMNNSIS